MRPALGPKILTCLLALGTCATAAAQEDELTFNLRDETGPAGSLVQLKLEETVATPISGGRPRMRFSSGLTPAGIAIIADGGELAGAAVIDGDDLDITYVTTAPASGGEYPILTASFRLDPDLAVGTELEVTLDPSLWQINGVAVPSRAATATVTVGGTLAVTNVVPGQGFFPEGTIVSIQGVGFGDDMRVRLDGDELDDLEVVGPTEMRFALPEAMNLAGAELRVDQRETGERVFYYSYLRGTPAATSQRSLLSKVLPIFSGVTRSQSMFGPIAPLALSHQYAALALQNPSLGPVEITLDLFNPRGRRVRSTTWPLESGQRLTLELSELFHGARIPCNGSVRVSSPVPVESFGLLLDEQAGSVTPRLLPEGPARPPRQPRCRNRR